MTSIINAQQERKLVKKYEDEIDDDYEKYISDTYKAEKAIYDQKKLKSKLVKKNIINRTGMGCSERYMTDNGPLECIMKDAFNTDYTESFPTFKQWDERNNLPSKHYWTRHMYYKNPNKLPYKRYIDWKINQIVLKRAQKFADEQEEKRVKKSLFRRTCSSLSSGCMPRSTTRRGGKLHRGSGKRKIRKNKTRKNKK